MVQDSEVLVPAGSVVRGTVATVQPAGNIDRSGRLTLNFDQLTIRRRNYQIRALPTQASRAAASVRKVIGAAIGAGGVIAATEGKDVVLPQGSVIRLHVDAANVRTSPSNFD